MKRITLLIAITFMVSLVQAQTTHNPNVKIVLVRYIHDGLLTYPYTYEGVKDHHELLKLKMETMDTYSALKPIIDKMSSKKRTANTLSIVFGCVGAGAAGYGGYISATTEDFVGYKINKEHTLGIGLIMGGVAFAVGGILFPQIANKSGQEDDIMKYINSYNTINAEKPLEVY
jgi:hypothetical protein